MLGKIIKFFQKEDKSPRYNAKDVRYNLSGVKYNYKLAPLEYYLKDKYFPQGEVISREAVLEGFEYYLGSTRWHTNACGLSQIAISRRALREALNNCHEVEVS